MKIVIDFDPSCAARHVGKGKNIVVVDVLRATSTIVAALQHGAAQVVPFSDIECAREYAKKHSAVLVGERHAEKIDGFDYTNSPLDMINGVIKGRKIAITTSTGTRLLVACSKAQNILIASTLNAKFAAKRMRQIGGNWAVIGAGSRGKFRAEDKVGCALVSKYFLDDASKYEVDHKTREIIEEYSKDVDVHIRNSISAEKLVNLGRQNDVDFVISSINNYPIVPEAVKVGNEHFIIRAI